MPHRIHVHNGDHPDPGRATGWMVSPRRQAGRECRGEFRAATACPRQNAWSPTSSPTASCKWPAAHITASPSSSRSCRGGIEAPSPCAFRRCSRSLGTSPTSRSAMSSSPTCPLRPYRRDTHLRGGGRDGDDEMEKTEFFECHPAPQSRTPFLDRLSAGRRFRLRVRAS